MPSWLHVLLRVTRPLCSLKGTITLGMFPQGCADTVVCRQLLIQGVGQIYICS